MPKETLRKNPSSDRRYGIHVGIVKRNDDPQRMGRCSVWIPEFGGDPDNEGNWFVVGYASPFAGSTPVRENRKDGADQEATQTAYGFWMNPPDLDNHVLVAFADGDASQGYWFGCIFAHNMNHAVPGIANNISTDDGLTGQGIYPPTVEYNKRSDQNPDQPHRPTFEPLHTGLTNQGLYPDAERGRSTSSARREAPSKVMGWTTPRGQSLVYDDNPENEFVRIRTRGGTQVLVHETSGYVYINSKNGNSWIEVSDEAIDVYSKKSINIRSEEDINIRAERDVNIEGERGVFVRTSKVLTIESGDFTHVKAGADIQMSAGGALTLLSGSPMLRTAPLIHDNGPAAPVASVKQRGERVNVEAPITAGQAQSHADSVSEASEKVQEAAPKLAETAATAVSAATTVSSEAATEKANYETIKSQIQAGTYTGTKTLQEVETTLTNLNTVSSVTASVNRQLTGINGIAGQITKASGQLGGIAQQAQNAAGQLKTVLNSTTSLTGVVDNAIAGASNRVNGALNDVLTKATSGIDGAVNQIGGSLGSKLVGPVGKIAGNAASQLTGAVQGTLGQASNIANKLGDVKVDGIINQGLGAIDSARNLFGNVMGEAQEIGNKINRIADTATGAAAKLTNLANIANLPISSGAKTALQTASGQLNSAAASVKAGGVATAAAASAGVASATQKNTKMTIVSRMPTHEPWPWHVKEGQQSENSKQTSDEERALDIANAAARPGQGAMNATPEVATAFEKIQTGTGEVTKKIENLVGPVTRIGTSLVQNSVLTAVKEAASISGVDVGYLMAKASTMGFDPLTKIGTATGLMQVTQSAFDNVVSRYGASIGISSGDLHDPRANAIVGALIAKENTTFLSENGVGTGPTELNMAHLMGAPVTSKFLTMLARDPTAAAFAHVPEDFLSTHREFFYGANGVAKTLQEVYNSIDNKISGAAQNFKEVLSTIQTTAAVPAIPPGMIS